MFDASISNRLEQAVLKVYEAINKKHCRNWKDHDESYLWQELVACILGSKVPFEHAQTALTQLKRRGLLDVNDYLKNDIQFETKIAEALSIPMVYERTPKRIFRYRYPRLRANHICRTAELIYRRQGSIKAILEAGGDDPRLTRIRIMSSSVGVGPKQSSLFLRNIDYTDDLAVLDSHILRYMSLLGILRVRIQVLSSLSRYQEVEEQFCAYTKKLGVNLAYLDTAVWVTMRVFQKELIV